MQPEQQSLAQLPQPDAKSCAHSERVAERIREAIAAAGGRISFAEFMRIALYEPGLGYYSAGATKFGRAGDFVTAPELSPLFGRVLARQCGTVLTQLGGGDILELGAGSGALAVTLLTALDESGQIPDHYYILEVSADLRARQAAAIKQAVPALAERVEWLDAPPRYLRGVIIGNEILDALPVERFVRQPDSIQQVQVGWRDDERAGGGFCWHSGPAPQWLADSVKAIESALGQPLETGYMSEVSLGLPGWLGDVSKGLSAGFVFLFDYGLPRRDYYAQERSTGLLRCHFRHRVHSDPLLHPGIQDLSAWVDFTAVAEAADAAGLIVSGYTTQAHFLLGGGLAEELADLQSLPPARQAELSRQVKLLTLPGEMGESFKCIGLMRGALRRPGGFEFADQRQLL